MFPANALLYRKGYINQGETVVHEERTLQSIYDRKMPMVSEENSFDPNRASYSQINPARETVVSPLAHFPELLKWFTMKIPPIQKFLRRLQV